MSSILNQIGDTLADPTSEIQHDEQTTKPKRGRPRESQTENARLGRALGTQSDIAQLLGVSKRTVGRAERDPDFWAAEMYGYALRYLLYCRDNDAGPFDPTRAD